MVLGDIPPGTFIERIFKTMENKKKIAEMYFSFFFILRDFMDVTYIFMEWQNFRGLGG